MFITLPLRLPFIAFFSGGMITLICRFEGKWLCQASLSQPYRWIFQLRSSPTHVNPISQGTFP
jgi:hypothetical protein